MKKVNAVGYIRVSTEEQAEEGYSLQAQEEMIRKACELQGKELVRVYIDKGISGKSTKDRHSLQEMIEDSKKGVFDEVIVWKTSRLARNVLDLLQIVYTLEQNKVTFRSLTEPYDTSTAQGKLMMNMLASFAEFERTTIIDNLKLGMNARARLGYKNGGRLIGYESIGQGRDSSLVIIPHEAETVRMIFRMYTEGKGYKAIANHLNKLGFKTVKANPFSINGIKEILCNPTYVGKIRFNRYIDYSSKRRKGANENCILVDGKHEAIIDGETWEKVSIIHEKKSQRFSTENKGKFPLTGMLRCPDCGAGMVAANTVNTLKDGSKKKIRYYTCGNYKNKGSAICKANSVRADYAEEYVMDKIQEILMNDEVMLDIVENINLERRGKIEPLLQKKETIINKMREVRAKKGKVFELFEESLITKEEISERIGVLDQIISENEKELKEIEIDLNENSKDEIPFTMVKSLMSDFGRLLDNAEPRQRKVFLQLVIDRITVTKGKIKEIHIQFNETIRSLIILYKGNKEELSNDEGSSSSFVFKIAI